MADPAYFFVGVWDLNQIRFVFRIWICLSGNGHLVDDNEC